VTLCNPMTGQSESLPVAGSTTVAELTELSKALLGMEGDVSLVKDGRVVTTNESLTLAQVGVQNGDLLAAVSPSAMRRGNPNNQATSRAPAPAPAVAAAAASGGGGLDFSSLLSTGGGVAAAPAGGGGGLTFQLPTPANPDPVYFPGMTLADAVDANPHPAAIVKLLQENILLFKELNHHNPTLAGRLQGQPYDRAVQIWREDMVKGGIQSAVAQSQAFLKQQDYTRRLQANPNDMEAKEYFDKQRRLKLVQRQYMQAMQEYPESMGRVLMLYIELKINDRPLQAFVDSGAQTTIMSKKCAQKCGIFDLVDTRFAGIAVGVGTGTILGRIHIVELQIGHVRFPCSVTIMDDAALPSVGPSGTSITGEDGDKVAPKDMDFLLGLDMLKRHQCCIDLEHQKLQFRLGPGQYFDAPFLHEKDLDESKGGTKGFNATKANEEIDEARRKQEEQENKNAMNDD
jgi:hypothetical protein